MSGPMSTQQREAIDSALAQASINREREASGLPWPEFLRQRARNTLGDSLAVRTWREMPLAVRTVFVMMNGVEVERDPREVAAWPWTKFDEKTRLRLGSACREFQRALVNAGALH